MTTFWVLFGIRAHVDLKMPMPQTCSFACAVASLRTVVRFNFERFLVSTREYRDVFAFLRESPWRRRLVLGPS